MFGLDQQITAVSDGKTLALVLAVAIVLGLRHATDPDHLAALSALIAVGRERTARSAAKLGLIWGTGHATTLFAFGLPIILFRAYLPERVVQGAEVIVGVLIVVLALWLLARWRRGLFHVHVHSHGQGHHAHGHTHVAPARHAHSATPRVRSPLQAYGIGLVHGLGGSAGVGVLLLATIQNRALAVVAMALFAIFTAVSMALISTGFGLTLASPPARRSFHRMAPALGLASLIFGCWYALGALDVVPYYA